MSANISAFISCTDKDLRAHRAAVKNALNDEGVVAISMEGFPAESEIPLKVCLKKVAQAKLFIGIYAWRYGFIPQGSEISITEHELRKAEELDRPRLFFLVEEGYPWPEEHREEGKAAELLQSLKQRISAGSTIKTFTSPDDLARKVSQAVRPYVQRASRPQALRLLLEAVETSSERFLERTAPETRRIVLEMRETEPSLPEWQEEPATLHANSKEAILKLFEKRERKLLILGEAGSGKTTTLRLLARGLVEVAEDDPETPVPLVLNLASWGERPQSLEQWLAQEIAASYSTGTQVALEWVRDHKILPLLDGLDEIRTDRQAACAAAINDFIPEHALIGLVVCCRTQAYREMGVPLRLATALILQSLSSDQVDGHLSAAGVPGEDLGRVLSEDPDLRELAESPQLLSLMEKICRNAGVQALTGPPGASPADRRRKLFSDYVALSLKNRPPRPYSPERMLSSLAWLAERMKRNSSPQFRLEQLQPSWLATSGERWMYALASRSLAGALLVLPAALGLRSALVLAFGFFAGALVGAVDAVGLRRSLAAGLPHGVRQGLLRSVVHLAGYGAGAFFLFYLAAVRLPTPGLDTNEVHGNAVRGGLLFALLFGVVLGLRSAQRDGSNDVRVAEALTWKRWSWRGMRRGALSGVIPLLIVGGLQLLASQSDLPALAAIGLFFVLVGALGGGLLGGVEVRIIGKKVQPNEGIWRTLRNTGLLVLATSLASSLLGVTVFAVLKWWGKQGFRKYLLWSPLWGAMLGLWIGLWFSGLDFLHHFVLRGLLRLRGYAPARYVRFLDAADRSGLLHRDRGSYTFLYGSSLLDHFAGLPSPADDRSQSSAITRSASS